MDWTEQAQPEAAPVSTARRACGNRVRHYAAKREMWRPRDAARVAALVRAPDCGDCVLVLILLGF
jgi:hypothetical protein